MQPCYDLYVNHQNILSLELIQLNKIQQFQNASENQNNNYFFVALQLKQLNHMQIAVYNFYTQLREIAVVSGPEIGPNHIKTQSNALALPIQDVFQVKVLNASVDQDDNSIILKIRMLVWTLKCIYIVQWRKDQLIQMLKKPNFRKGLVKELPIDFMVCKFVNPFIGKPENIMEVNENRFLYINCQNQLLQLNLIGGMQCITQDKLGKLQSQSRDSLYFPPMELARQKNEEQTQGFIIVCQNRVAPALIHIMKNFTDNCRIERQENVKLRQNRTQGPIMNFVLSQGKYVQEMFAICGVPGIVQKIQMGTKISANIGAIPNINGLLDLYTFHIKDQEFLVLSSAVRSISIKLIHGNQFDLVFNHELSQVLNREQRTLICEMIIDNNFLLIGTSSRIQIIDINTSSYAQIAPIIIHPTPNNEMPSQGKISFQQFSFNGHTLMASLYNSSSTIRQNQIHAYNIYSICNTTTSSSAQATILKSLSSNKVVLSLSEQSENKSAQNWGNELSAISSAPLSSYFETYDEVSKFGCIALLAYWNGKVQFRHSKSSKLIETLKRKQNSYPICSIAFLPAFTGSQQIREQKNSEFVSMYQLIMGNLDGSVDIMLYNPRAAQLLAEGQQEELQNISVISLRRVIAVGNTPINLTTFMNQDHYCVLLGCDYPTVLYWINEKEFVNSRLLCDEVNQACKFSKGLVLYSIGEEGGNIVLTQPGSISRLQIDSYDSKSLTRNMQFDTSDENIHMSIKNLCYIQQLQAIALLIAIEKNQDIKSQETKQNSSCITRIILCRAGNMSVIDSYDLGEKEDCHPFIYESEIILPFNSFFQILLLLIGTALIQQGEFIPESGRLLALSINKTQQQQISALDDQIDSQSLLTLHSQKLFNGGVFQIKKFKKYDDIYICGIGNTLQIVKLQVETEGFIELGQIRSNLIFIVCIDNIQDQILVGDVSNGIQLFQATPQMIQNSQNQINTFQLKRLAGSITRGIVSVVLFINKDLFLTADDYSNILAYNMKIIFQKNRLAAHLHRSELTPACGFKVGNKVTKLQEGSLVKITQGFSAQEINPSTGVKYEGFKHSIIYSTNTGAIGVLILISNNDIIRFLKRVEAGMDISLRPIAGVKRGTYRNSWARDAVQSSVLAERDNRGVGFVDMEFLEQFSRLEPMIMQVIVDHAATPQWTLKNYPNSNQELVSMIQCLKKYY